MFLELGGALAVQKSGAEGLMLVGVRPWFAVS